MPPTDPLRAAVEPSLAAIDWAALAAGRRYHPSPAAWEDEVLYFLMLDRFSDGWEFGGFGDLAGAPVSGPSAARTTPRFALQHAGTADPAAWFEAGKGWCGGTLVGLADKLGYLKRLGVTALWLSLATTAGGVFAGARMPHQGSITKPGKPASSMVGTSGSALERFAPVVASARNRVCASSVHSVTKQ